VDTEAVVKHSPSSLPLVLVRGLGGGEDDVSIEQTKYSPSIGLYGFLATPDYKQKTESSARINYTRSKLN